MKRDAASIKDVAQRAGVSVGTVSNVLNHPSRVTAATRDRVHVAIDELGFVRNGSASRLRSLRNNVIGLVVIDVGNPFFTEILRGVEETAEAADFTVMLCNADSSYERELRHLRQLEEHRVAGVLITPSFTEPLMPRIDALVGRGVAVVLVDEPTDRPDLCSVTVDDVHGGELAGRHLLGLGRRRLVYVQTVESFRQFEERLAGLRSAIAAHPDSASISLTVVRLRRLEAEDGAAAVDAVLRSRPDAVFCANDLVALGVLGGLQAKGIRVPDDVALVGYDDIPFASMASVPLTTIRQPARLLGETTARLLIDECTGASHVHEHVTYLPELVVRASTAAIAPGGGR